MLNTLRMASSQNTFLLIYLIFIFLIIFFFFFGIAFFLALPGLLKQYIAKKGPLIALLFFRFSFKSKFISIKWHGGAHKHTEP